MIMLCMSLIFLRFFPVMVGKGRSFVQIQVLSEKTIFRFAFMIKNLLQRYIVILNLHTHIYKS